MGKVVREIQTGSAKLAEHIEVKRSGRKARLTIDGREFPWFIADEGIALNVHRDAAPGITLTLIAERVSVDDSLGFPDKERAGGGG